MVANFSLVLGSFAMLRLLTMASCKCFASIRTVMACVNNRSSCAKYSLESLKLLAPSGVSRVVTLRCTLVLDSCLAGESVRSRSPSANSDSLSTSLAHDWCKSRQSSALSSDPPSSPSLGSCTAAAWVSPGCGSSSPFVALTVSKPSEKYCEVVETFESFSFSLVASSADPPLLSALS